MTTGHKPAPQHGGLQRIALNGGDTVRVQLSFLATSVNVDNWSPYWYKLAPIEEYIPPFQHGINVSLPLMHDFEFICQAPPGIEQSVIIPTTGVAGNTRPLIAVFSSLPTNNDAGFSALEASSNKSTVFTAFNGNLSVTIDVTLYDGIYIDVIAASQCVIQILYFDPVTSLSTTLYTRIMHTGLQLLLTIPKLYKEVLFTIGSDPNRVVALSGSYSIRPFIGPLPFSAMIMPKALGALVPRDTTSITGENTATFTTIGLDNANLLIMPNGGAGVTVNTIYWIKVFITNYSAAIANFLVYSRSFIGGNSGSLVLPLNGILSGVIETITVFVRPSEAGVTLATAVTELSLHQNTEQALTLSNYSQPIQATFRNTVVTVAGSFVITTLPVGGMLKSLWITVITTGPAGSQISFGLGSAVIANFFFADVATNVIGTYKIDNFEPIRLDNGFNTLWGASSGAGIQYTYTLSVF